MPVVPNVNLDEVEGSMPLLTPGVAGFIITNSAVKNSKQNNPKLVFSMDVIQGPDEGKNAMLQFSLLPQALWKLRTFRDAVLGAAYKQDSHDLDSEAFHGRKFRATVSHKDFTNDKSEVVKSNEIDSFMPWE